MALPIVNNPQNVENVEMLLQQSNAMEEFQITINDIFKNLGNAFETLVSKVDILIAGQKQLIDIQLEKLRLRQLDETQELEANIEANRRKFDGADTASGDGMTLSDRIKNALMTGVGSGGLIKDFIKLVFGTILGKMFFDKFIYPLLSEEMKERVKDIRADIQGGLSLFFKNIRSAAFAPFTILADQLGKLKNFISGKIFGNQDIEAESEKVKKKLAPVEKDGFFKKLFKRVLAPFLAVEATLDAMKEEDKELFNVKDEFKKKTISVFKGIAEIFYNGIDFILQDVIGGIFGLFGFDKVKKFFKEADISDGVREVINEVSNFGFSGPKNRENPGGPRSQTRTEDIPDQPVTSPEIEQTSQKLEEVNEQIKETRKNSNKRSARQTSIRLRDLVNQRDNIQEDLEQLKTEERKKQNLVQGEQDDISQKISKAEVEAENVILNKKPMEGALLAATGNRINAPTVIAPTIDNRSNVQTSTNVASTSKSYSGSVDVEGTYKSVGRRRGAA